MWRERRAGRAAGVTGDGFRSADEERWARILLDAGAGAAGDRFLAAYTVPGLAWSATARAEAQDMADGLVLAGVLTDATCAALAPDATAEQLLPHDAAFVLEGSGADLVLIEAAALLPGGAWAHAGDPAATDRGRRLADLIDLARALGKPVIFLRNAPSYLMPYLDWLGTSCDAVVDGGLGVQLARFNPVDLPAARGAVPVYAGHRDLREGPAVRRLLDELTGADPDTGQDNGRAIGGTGERLSGDAGARISERASVRAGVGGDPARAARIIGEPSWRAAPGVYRQHAVFLAATAAEAREQLACGAHVVGPVTEDTEVSGATAVRDAEEAARQLTAAAGAGPRGLAEIKATLLELFEAHATPARLAELGRLVDLPVRPVPGRRVAVLAGVRDAADAGRLAERVLRQRLHPHEVRVWLEGDMSLADPAHALAHAAREQIAGALTPLTAEGIIAGVVTGAGLAAAARAAVSPWSAEWDPQLDYPASYLLEAHVRAGVLPRRRGRPHRRGGLRVHRRAGSGRGPDRPVPRGRAAAVGLGPPRHAAVRGRAHRQWPGQQRGQQRGRPREPDPGRYGGRYCGTPRGRVSRRFEEEGIVHVRTAGRVRTGGSRRPVTTGPPRARPGHARPWCTATST